jgi:hypothetical protein
MDVALTNSWVYYSLANPDEAKKDGARANFSALESWLVKQNIDWESKYKDNTKKSLSTEADIMDVIIPRRVAINREQQQKNDNFMQLVIGEECVLMALSTIPFPLKLRSKTCQVRRYEMKNDKWKGVVFCASHRLHLCSESSPPRALTGPELVKLDGSKVMDLSWTCPDEGSCWEKFQNYLFNSKGIDVSQQKIKFGGPIYISNLY